MISVDDIKVGDRFVIMETAVEIEQWDTDGFSARVNQTEFCTEGTRESFVGFYIENKGERATDQSWQQCIDLMKERMKNHGIEPDGVLQ